MKRILYLYPEEWTGRRARELHTLQTCLALAEAGVDVSLVTAGGFNQQKAIAELGLSTAPELFHSYNLTRKIGPIKSVRIFAQNLIRWLKHHSRFDIAYIIHLKAADVLQKTKIPYIWEAHEIFAETPAAGTRKAQQIEFLEAQVIQHATEIVATSSALAHALATRYFPQQKPRAIHVVPHGGAKPQPHSLADAAGPFVYAGSLQDWKGIEFVIQAAEKLDMHLRIVGGTKKEIEKAVVKMQHVKRLRLSPQRRIHIVRHVEWRERIRPDLLPQDLLGCRAGLNPTLSHTPSGHYSLPMKVYDYASCGLPVISSPLLSMTDLSVEKWCHFTKNSTVDAWSMALMQPIDANQGQAALEWAQKNTWRHRGKKLAEIISAL